MLLLHRNSGEKQKMRRRLRRLEVPSPQLLEQRHKKNKHQQVIHEKFLDKSLVALFVKRRLNYFVLHSADNIGKKTFLQLGKIF